jgi:DNA polymerase-3 subunit epsilon
MKIAFLRVRIKPATGLPEPQPSDFLALDFETANETRGSACAVGVVLVRDGEVIAEGSSLIDPEQAFNSYNIYIHGIDEEAVRGAPTFPRIWPQLAGLLDRSRVVAHNATFDMSVLRNAAARYDLTSGPAFDLFCTYRLAKRVWTDLPSYSLGYLAPRLGVHFDHHDAGEDARACAEVAIILCREQGARTLDELASLLGAFPGRVTADSYVPFRTCRAGKLTSVEGREDADPDHPLYGRSICFTGTLASMPRRDAMARVTEVGCDFKNSVSKRLDYLVIGDADFVQFADGWQTGKLKKAVELCQQGAPIEIIPERHFIELLFS